MIIGSSVIKNKTIKLSARDQPYLDDELIKAQSDFQGNRVVPIALSTMSNPTPVKEKEAALNFLYKAVPSMTNSPSKSKFAGDQTPQQLQSVRKRKTIPSSDLVLNELRHSTQRTKVRIAATRNNQPTLTTSISGESQPQ